MASRIWKRVSGLVNGQILINGSFRPQGTSAPVISDGKGFSVARSGTGLYLVTFDDKYYGLVSSTVSLRTADATLAAVQCGDFSLANKTLQIRTFTNSGSAGEAGKGFIPLELTTARELSSNDTINLAGHGGILASDSTPTLAAVNAGTDQALIASWAASNNDKLTWAVPLPADLDSSSDVTVHFMGVMGGSTDTPTLSVEAFFGIADSDAGGTTGALADGSYAEVSVTIAAANVPSPPNWLTITVAPGAHTTDAVNLGAAWIEYTKVTSDVSRLVLADLSADADNEVGFQVAFRNRFQN